MGPPLAASAAFSKPDPAAEPAAPSDSCTLWVSATGPTTSAMPGPWIETFEWIVSKRIGAWQVQLPLPNVKSEKALYAPPHRPG